MSSDSIREIKPYLPTNTSFLSPNPKILDYLEKIELLSTILSTEELDPFDPAVYLHKLLKDYDSEQKTMGSSWLCGFRLFSYADEHVRFYKPFSQEKELPDLSKFFEELEYYTKNCRPDQLLNDYFFTNIIAWLFYFEAFLMVKKIEIPANFKQALLDYQIVYPSVQRDPPNKTYGDIDELYGLADLFKYSDLNVEQRSKIIKTMISKLKTSGAVVTYCFATIGSSPKLSAEQREEVIQAILKQIAKNLKNNSKEAYRMIGWLQKLIFSQYFNGEEYHVLIQSLLKLLDEAFIWRKTNRSKPAPSKIIETIGLLIINSQIEIEQTEEIVTILQREYKFGVRSDIQDAAMDSLTLIELSPKNSVPREEMINAWISRLNRHCSDYIVLKVCELVLLNKNRVDKMNGIVDVILDKIFNKDKGRTVMDRLDLLEFFITNNIKHDNIINKLLLYFQQYSNSPENILITIDVISCLAALGVNIHVSNEQRNDIIEALLAKVSEKNIQRDIIIALGVLASAATTAVDQRDRIILFLLENKTDYQWRGLAGIFFGGLNLKDLNQKIMIEVLLKKLRNPYEYSDNPKQNLNHTYMLCTCSKINLKLTEENVSFLCKVGIDLRGNEKIKFMFHLKKHLELFCIMQEVEKHSPLDQDTQSVVRGYLTG